VVLFLLLEGIFDSNEVLLYLFGFLVVFAQVVRVDHVRLLHSLEAYHIISDFKRNESVRKQALSSDSLVGPILHLEEVEHVAQVLVSLLVINRVNQRILPVLPRLHIVLQNELLPNGNDLAEVRLRVVVKRLALLAESLAHVVITRAHAE
jgi:hypothetical protein